MSIAETDWQRFLSPGSDLPPDVIFNVEGEDDKSEGQRYQKKIGAHRLFLAGVSPVFKSMFFGLLKETGEVVEVKEISPEAFDTMIKFIYHPPGGERFNLDHIRCPQKLFELLTVSTKYQIWRLVTLTTDVLESLAITRENVIFTATISKGYKTAFDDVSTKLLMKCMKFLFNTTSGAVDMCALIQETLVNFPGASFDILPKLLDVVKSSLQVPGIYCWF